MLLCAKMCMIKWLLPSCVVGTLVKTASSLLTVGTLVLLNDHSGLPFCEQSQTTETKVIAPLKQQLTTHMLFKVGTLDTGIVWC